MTKREAAIVTAYTGVMIGDFRFYHEYVTKLLGRQVHVGELGTEAVDELIREKSKNDFLSIEVKE